MLRLQREAATSATGVFFSNQSSLQLIDVLTTWHLMLKACQRNCAGKKPLKLTQFWVLGGPMLEKICPRRGWLLNQLGAFRASPEE